jgi:hypothetical protein
MEALSLIVICTASFGLIAATASAIHHYLLSRNANLNQLAREKAIGYQQQALKNLRDEIKGLEFTSHHALIEENKEAIIKVDGKINSLIEEKTKMVERYANLIYKRCGNQSSVDCEENQEHLSNMLKGQMKMLLTQMDEKLKYLQDQRSGLWTYEQSLESKLMKTEDKRNARLNKLYKQHGELLDKLQLAQNEAQSTNTEKMADTSSSLFESMIMAPIRVIPSFFSSTINTDYEFSLRQARIRASVKDTEDRFSVDISPSKVQASVAVNI